MAGQATPTVTRKILNLAFKKFPCYIPLHFVSKILATLASTNSKKTPGAPYYSQTTPNSGRDTSQDTFRPKIIPIFGALLSFYTSRTCRRF